MEKERLEKEVQDLKNRVEKLEKFQSTAKRSAARMLEKIQSFKKNEDLPAHEKYFKEQMEDMGLTYRRD